MNNKFSIVGDIIHIDVEYKGEFYETTVSVNKLEKLMYLNVNWKAVKNKKNMYVQASQYAEREVKTILMHRYLTDAPKGKVVDHKNGNGLCNEDWNLNVVTYLENAQNTRVIGNSKSGFNGVTWDNARKKWRATIQDNGKLINLGSFVYKDDAVDARKDAEEIYYPYLTEISKWNNKQQ